MGMVNWPLVAGTAALAAIASVLTSIAGVSEVRDSQ
ncbi:holin [Bifidobacterium sp. B4114]